MPSMLGTVTIDRRTGNGKYGDVLDVCSDLAVGDYGSTVNALVVMARQSPLFAETQERIRKRKAAKRPRS